MNLTSLDLATRLCGWTTGDGSTVPKCDVWKLPDVGADLGQMLDEYDRALYHHVETYRPDAIGYEAPIIVHKASRTRQYADKPLTLRKIYSLGAHTEFVCLRRGIECSEIGLRKIKAELTGDSLASKASMVDMARRLGLTLPTGPGAEDAADSFGGFLVMLRHYDKEASRAWDVRIMKARGGLT